MTDHERFVLASGAGLTAVRDLPEEIRRRFHHSEDDVALTSPQSPSQILSAQAASLVEGFRSPARIVDAVLEYAAANSLDPGETLSESLPLLQSLIDDGFLVHESPGTGRAQRLQPGDAIAGYRIVDRIRVLDDAEVFQIRKDGRTFALKIPRNRSPAPGPAFAREAAILRRLDGTIAPRLIADEIEGRPALIVEWCQGINAEKRAAELREEGRHGLLSLCRDIASAYARLHQAGIVHGSVHPRDIGIARDGRVRLVDFGRSTAVPFYCDPDQARAMAGGRTPPPASFRSDQYSVAALLYSLVTGFHYLDFSRDRLQMLRQILEDQPLPFTERGVEAWPELEAILARGMSKDAGSRFESMRALADALEGIADLAEPARRPVQQSPDLADAFIRELSADGELFALGVPVGPPSSMAYGAAGIAYVLYRLSRARNDARLLSLARAWTDRASMADEAFVSEAMGLTRDVVSAVSPYHARSGVALVRALIGFAGGDDALLRRATGEFLETAFADEPNLDLLTGRSGALLGAAILLGITPSSSEERSRILEAGQSLMLSIVSDLERQPAIPDITPLANFGMAHGWSGNLYAIMRWCRSSGVSLPAMVAPRLDELRELAIDRGRGLCWTWQGRGRLDTTPVGGWCQGSAGFVHLWTLAHDLLGDARFAELAEGAGWYAWEAEEADGNLCCGLAGRAYALLELYFRTGETSWLDRARRLTARAIAGLSNTAEPRFSFYKGVLGIALLQSELECGVRVSMPMFGEEVL